MAWDRITAVCLFIQHVCPPEDEEEKHMMKKCGNFWAVSLMRVHNLFNQHSLLLEIIYDLCVATLNLRHFLFSFSGTVNLMK